MNAKTIMALSFIYISIWLWWGLLISGPTPAINKISDYLHGVTQARSENLQYQLYPVFPKSSLSCLRFCCYRTVFVFQML